MKYVWACLSMHVLAVTDNNTKPAEKCPTCNRSCHSGKKFPIQIADEAAVDYQVGAPLPGAPAAALTLGSSEWLTEGYGVLSFAADDGKANVSLHRYFSPVVGADHTTLLLVSHGRQDLTSPGSTDSGLIGRYAYISRKGESVVRQFHYNRLPELAYVACKHRQEWQESDVPNAYVGPHGGGDGIENEKAQFNNAVRAVLDFCDVAVMTHLYLAPNCGADYRNDGKIPLRDVIRPLMKLGYRNFLLMCCRSPWEPGKVEMASGSPQKESGMLFSYDDTRQHRVS
jgi:hypothetical protein